jgi:hypothetical protein
MKTTRSIKTFEADEDVARMITTAQEAGFPFVQIANKVRHAHRPPPCHITGRGLS